MPTEQTLEIAKAGIRMYSIWQNMKGRCNSLTDPAYNRYGGRGVSVEWNSFEEFFQDMYPTYSDSLSLDRINNDGNYSKSNCKWSTSKEQQNNTSKNRKITFNGVTKTLSQWSDHLNIGVTTLRQRLDAYGWSETKALSTPARSWRRN